MSHKNSDAAMQQTNQLMDEQMQQNREELRQKAEQMEALRMGVVKSMGNPDWNE